ncbi:MAG: endolytic transglycosylase MltG [Betaproteobacteria bacterium]|nr:MAG: endolytic transglycosylase MltG [Betaproteobacteria bacterium]
MRVYGAISVIGRLIRLSFWGAIAFLAWAAWILLQPVADARVPYEFTVRRGQSLSGVVHELAARGAIVQPWVLTAYGRLTGQAAQIKPGVYRVEQPLSPYALFNKMVSGDRLLVKVTLIEGWNLDQVRAVLARQDHLVHESAALSGRALAQHLGGDYPNAEGLLFPDTYYLGAGEGDLALMRQAAHAMQDYLAQAWEKRAPNLPYRNAYEALIMASIIEKETGAAVERPEIAAVFINRLRIGMPLQTDPTVIYGLGARFDGDLRRADLRADTVYNTYTRRGLPPTPIAMPGQAAIAAALHPTDSKALYFVAKGDGTHQFSATLDAHNRAVRQYQRRAVPAVAKPVTKSKAKPLAKSLTKSLTKPVKKRTQREAR